MRFSLFILFILLIIIMNNSITHSIFKRNEYDYPRTYTYLYRDLLRDLQKLRELNDPVINEYINNIEKAINIGDYSKLMELLRNLSNYLESKGYSSENYEYVSILNKLLKALESAGPQGLEINYEKLDPYLRSLIESASLREIILTLDVQKILSLLEKYGGVFSSISDTSRNTGDQGFSGLKDFSLPIASNNPLPNVFSGIPLPNFNFSLTTSSIVELVVIISIASISIFLLFFFLKYKRVFISEALSETSHTLYKSIKKIIPSFRNNVVDPVVSIYNKWYVLTKRRGYRRISYETLREYLSNIREIDLKNIGYRVTSIYEDRIYGNKEIDGSELIDIENFLNRVEKEEND